ncbi:MAG: AbrB/MazE/SpoVT family DNA-binding domain-containing protein [Candidatus Saccharimonadales bacterium]
MFNKMKFYGSATVGTKGQIVIPAEAREELAIGDGDKLIVVKMPHGDGLVVLKADLLQESLGKMQASLVDMVKSVKEMTAKGGRE